MKTAIGHLRANAIAYLALFVALGGTSYAAVSLPRNSVGTAQLRNGAVTPAKLNAASGVPYVAFWARVDNMGRVLASSRPATTSNWTAGRLGVISFSSALPSDCFALATVIPSPSAVVEDGYVTIGSDSFGGKTNIVADMTGANGLPTPLSLYVADLCP